MPRATLPPPVVGAHAQHFDFHLGGTFGARGWREPEDEIFADLAPVLQFSRESALGQQRSGAARASSFRQYSPGRTLFQRMSKVRCRNRAALSTTHNSGFTMRRTGGGSAAVAVRAANQVTASNVSAGAHQNCQATPAK